MGADRQQMYIRYYNHRLLELVSLADAAGQASIKQHLSKLLDIHGAARIKAAIERGPGPLSLEQLDRVAKRYSRWLILSEYEWKTPIEALGGKEFEIVEAYTQILRLDINLRREVEELLATHRMDPRRADQLRHRCEAMAGVITAGVDVAMATNRNLPGLAEVMGSCAAVWEELDALLILAGSPGPQEADAKPRPAPHAPETDVRFCISCGKNVTPGGRFCAYCGAATAGKQPAPLPPPTGIAEGYTAQLQLHPPVADTIAKLRVLGPPLPKPVALPYRPQSFDTLGYWTVGAGAIVTLAGLAAAGLQWSTLGPTIRYWDAAPSSNVQLVALEDWTDLRDRTDTAAAIAVAAYFVFFILVIVMAYRAQKQARAMGATGLPYRPGWAIAGWFVPLLNLVVPWQVLASAARVATAEPPIPLERRWRKSRYPASVVVAWGSMLAGIGLSQTPTYADTRSDDMLVTCLHSTGYTVLVVAVFAMTLWALRCRKGFSMLGA